MAVASWFNSVRMRDSFDLRDATEERPTTREATIDMMRITTSSSIKVNPALGRGRAAGRVPRSGAAEIGIENRFCITALALSEFFLHPFADPLFHHALVIRIT